MANLIKLELKRNKLHIYILAIGGIMVVMMGFLYLYAAVPHIDPNTSGVAQFSTYIGVMGLPATINTAAFCVLSAVMYSRFVIGEYRGVRAILLFSYPVSRRKVFLSKLMLVSLVTTVGLIVSDLIVFSVFLGIESVFPLVGDRISSGLISQLLFTTAITSVLAAAIGAISMTIGFHKKSTPVTMVSAIVLASLFCSAISSIGLNLFVIIAIGAVLVAAVIMTGRLSNKITYMEA